MKRIIQNHYTRTFIFGMLISVAALFSSCAPKYGCYYGMTETPSSTQGACAQDLAFYNTPAVEAMITNSR